MMNKAATEKELEVIQRMQALKLALEAAASCKATFGGDVDQHIEPLFDLVCDGLVGIDTDDIRYALCGPSKQTPHQLDLVHGQFSPSPDAANGIASVLDQIPAANWQHRNGVLAILTAAPDTLKLKQVHELCRAVNAQLPKDGMFFFGTATDARMTAGLCSVSVLAARWRN